MKKHHTNSPVNRTLFLLIVALLAATVLCGACVYQTVLNGWYPAASRAELVSFIR